MRRRRPEARQSPNWFFTLATQESGVPAELCSGGSDRVQVLLGTGVEVAVRAVVACQERCCRVSEPVRSLPNRVPRCVELVQWRPGSDAEADGTGAVAGRQKC